MAALPEDLAPQEGTARCASLFDDARVLRRFLRQLEWAFGGAGIGLNIIDPQYYLKYVDPHWQQVYGDFAGRHCYEYFLGEAEPCRRCGIQEALQNRRPSVRERILVKEGGRPVQVTTIPFEGSDGQWLVMQVNVDISERQQMAAELQLAQRLEAVGQLAAGIAHEINTPMQYIGDSVYFLQGAFDGLGLVLEKLQQCLGALEAAGGHEQLVAEVRTAAEAADLDYLQQHVPRALERTSEGIGRVTTIVQAMREFAHPHQHERAAVDLNRAIETALTVSRNEYKYVADVVTDLQDLPLVQCQAGEINQVLLNLIVNAAHAIQEQVGESGQRGEIRIRSRYHGSSVEISIEDTGPGVPEAVRERIFEPFFTTKPIGKGTGQGLAIARTIINRHEGRLTLRSAPDHGAIFIIELPVVEEEETEEAWT